MLRALGGDRRTDKILAAFIIVKIWGRALGSLGIENCDIGVSTTH
jgi:hypothetical protein